MLHINPSFNSKGERVAITLSPVYNVSPYKLNKVAFPCYCEKEIDIELFTGDPLTTSEATREWGRVNVRKDFWDHYRGLGKNGQ